jgi:hypothetical protein
MNNGLLYGLPDDVIAESAEFSSKVICGIKKRDHITPSLYGDCTGSQ